MVMPKPKTKDEVLQLCTEYKVRFAKLQFTDVNGFLKAVTIPVEKLEDAIEHNVWFDGSSIEGFTRIFESDMYLKLDLATFVVIPWTRGTDTTACRIICDVYMPDGKPFEGDPRYILKRQIERVRAKGLEFFVGPELEFFLFKKEDGKAKLIPNDKDGYFDQSTDESNEIRNEMASTLMEFGMEVEALHHEVAPGQHEIGFKYSDPLTQADNAITFKFIVKAIAAKHGLHATFMAKPIAGLSGSGMHVHQSVFNDAGENLFFDATKEDWISDLAKSFIAGQISHIKAMTAVLNPTVNSYKRLVAGYEAPVYIAWGHTNRSALIRIPRVSPTKPKGVRCELRSPDPTCNPYLAFAVMIASGLDGVENGLTPPPVLDENIFHLSDEDALNKGVDTLPSNLEHALHHLAKDEVLKEALGAHTYRMFMSAKSAEWMAYKASVSAWEVEKYLELY